MASISETKPSPKKGLFDKLPRLSTPVWLIIIGGIFVILMVPLVTDLITATSQHYELATRTAQLQSQYNDLMSKISAQSELGDQIKQNKKDLQAIKANYRKISENPEVSQAIVDIAWDHDITVTSIAVAIETSKVTNVEYPVLKYTVSLSGQVANFQNLLIAVGKKYPTCQILRVDITPSQVEGELDKATVVMQILCDRDV